MTSRASTQIGDDNEKDELKKSVSSTGSSENEKAVARAGKPGGSGGAYTEKGLMEIEEQGQKKQVRVVVEAKSGKELIKDVYDGPYTQPRWYVLVVKLDRVCMSH